MRHNNAGRKLGRSTSHRSAMLTNMVVSLLEHERIETTLPKAKEVRRVAEKVITLGKSNTIHSRRLAFRVVKNETIVKKVFDVLGPRFANRPGGYTRILKTGFRHGDNAEMSILELVERTPKAEPVKEEKAPKTEETKAGETKAEETKSE
jgi:large subunit ribosomal protein L17